MLYLSKTELVTSLQSVIYLDRVLSSSWSSTWSGPGSQVGQVGQDQGLNLSQVGQDQDWELNTTAILQSLLPHSGP